MKIIRFSRLHTKIFISFFLATMVFFGAANLILYPGLHQALLDSVPGEMRERVKTIRQLMQTALHSSIKNHLWATAQRNLQIVDYFYRQSRRGVLSAAAARDQARRVLLSQTIGKTGYFYVINSRGRVMIHPRRALLGTSVLRYPFIHHQIKAKNGYFSYDWKNPGEQTERQKSAYMIYFKPWDWIITASAYKEEFKHLVRLRDYRTTLSGIDFQGNGYLFMLDNRQRLLFHPAMYTDGQRVDFQPPVWMKQVTGRRLRKPVLLSAIQRRKDPSRRLIWVEQIPELNWIVGAAVSLRLYYKRLTAMNRLLMSAALALFVLIGLISWLLSRSITAPLERLIANFQAGSRGEQPVPMNTARKDEIGALIHYFNLFLQNLQELERKEAQLQQAQKMETIGTLAGGLAHDFNNILSGILGSTALIRFQIEEELDKEKTSQLLDTIEQASDRAAEIIKQLLTLARKSDLRSRPVDLNNSIRNVANICRNSFDKRIALEVNYPSGEAAVEGDPGSIEQILLNLCINASHAMTLMRSAGEAWGGILTIDLSLFNPDQKFTELHPGAADQPYWLIQIQDTGVGIPEEYREHIFEPFFSTKQQQSGTGLGLSMVYSMVGQLSGLITVYSQPGKGTSFNIFLPCSPGSVAAGERSGGEDEQFLHHGSGTVLVIDDDRFIRRTTDGMLQQCGYRVVTAADGHQGMELFRRSHNEFKLVILDMVMPDMTGREVFYRIRRISPQVPVLLCSGLRKDDRIRELLANPATAFLVKPFNMQRLSLLVKSLING